MLDLTEVDRQLSALGRVPQELASLIARHLGHGTQPEGRDTALDELSRGLNLRASALKAPPLPEAVPMVAVQPPPPEPQDLDQETEALLGGPTEPPADDDEPELSITEPPPSDAPGPIVSEPGRVSSAPPSLRHSWSWPGTGRDSSRPPRPSWPPAGVSEASQAEHEAPTALTSMSAAPPPKDRAEINALLDQDLDPSDFPRTEPPAAAQPAEDDDDFEMLIDDDEIVELEDDELEDVE